MEHSAVPATEWNRAMLFGLSSYLTFAPPRAASLFWGPLHSTGVLRPDAGCHLLAKSSLWWFLFLFPGGCSHRRTNLGCSLLCVVLTPTASSKAFFLTVTCLPFCFQIRSQLYHCLSCSQTDFLSLLLNNYLSSQRTTRHIAVFNIEKGFYCPQGLSLGGLWCGSSPFRVCTQTSRQITCYPNLDFLFHYEM